MTTDEQSRTATPSATPTSRVGSSPLGIGLATAFFLFGAANFYLIPTTGGLTSFYWNPILYDLFLSRPFLLLVYIPLVQLPLAAVYYLRSQERPAGRLGPQLVFGVFGLIAITRVTLLAAAVTCPLGPDSLRTLVNIVLYSELVGGAGIPELATTVYLWYFVGVVYAGLIANRPRYRDRDEADSSSRPSETGDGAAADRTGSAPAPIATTEGTRRGVRAEWSVPGVSGNLRIPFWALSIGVVVLLIAGLATGGLESAIGVASLLLSLYQLQPSGDS